VGDIAQAVQKNAGTYGIDNVIMLTCTVASADEAQRLCMVTPVNNNISSFPAQLMTEIDDGILFIPAKGSTVKVIFSNLNAPTVVQFSEIDKMFIVPGGGTFLVYSVGIELMGNSFGGIPKLQELTDNLNTLKGYIKNTLEPAIGNAFTAVGAGGAASGPNGKISFDASTSGQTITIKDMENAKVKHGNG